MTKDLPSIYSQRSDLILEPICEKLLVFLKELLADVPRIDQITARVKSTESFVTKASKVENGNPVYKDPIREIQDQIGARIVTFYLADVQSVAKIVNEYFNEIEQYEIVPDSDDEFGYFGLHYILFCPTDVLDTNIDDEYQKFFELQIKTLYQHAWSAANHDLGYKATTSLSSDERRKIAFTAAQSWGADQIFEELQASNQCLEDS